MTADDPTQGEGTAGVNTETINVYFRNADLEAAGRLFREFFPESVAERDLRGNLVLRTSSTSSVATTASISHRRFPDFRDGRNSLDVALAKRFETSQIQSFREVVSNLVGQLRFGLRRAHSNLLTATISATLSPLPQQGT